MPNTAEAHRISTGIFHPTLLCILRRKSDIIAGRSHNKYRRTKCSPMGELFSWLSCVSLSVIYCVSVLLLTRCMDVELNPGPVGGDNFTERTQDSHERRFAQILHCLQSQAMGLSRQMYDHFHSLGQSLQRIEEEVRRMKRDVRDNRSDISLLQQDSVFVHDRLEQLERQADRLDAASREKNLKFFGIFEPGPSDGISDVEEVVATLNHFSSTKVWQKCDIERTHRIGQPNRSSHTPRPLIVSFCHADRKLAILRDSHLRDGLRENGIRVSADLTPRQRDQVQQLKNQGKQAYYKNGRLHVNGTDSDEARHHSPEHAHRNDVSRDRSGLHDPASPQDVADAYNTSESANYNNWGNPAADRTDACNPNDSSSWRNPASNDNAYTKNGSDWGTSPHLHGSADFHPGWQDFSDWYSRSQYNMAYTFPPAYWPDSFDTGTYPPTSANNARVGNPLLARISQCCQV